MKGKIVFKQNCSNAKTILPFTFQLTGVLFLGAGESRNFDFMNHSNCIAIQATLIIRNPNSFGKSSIMVRSPFFFFFFE